MKIKTFEEYWATKIVANPDLIHEELKVTITNKSLKKELQKAFSAGSNVPLAALENTAAIMDKFNGLIKESGILKKG